MVFHALSFSDAKWANDSIIMPPRRNFYQCGIFSKEIEDAENIEKALFFLLFYYFAVAMGCSRCPV